MKSFLFLCSLFSFSSLAHGSDLTKINSGELDIGEDGANTARLTLTGDAAEKLCKNIHLKSGHGVPMPGGDVEASRAGAVECVVIHNTGTPTQYRATINFTDLANGLVLSADQD